MADPLDLAALARLDALERRATPGPWATDHEHTVAGEDETTLLCHALCEGGWTRVEDADLIVALRNAAPALLRAARDMGRIAALASEYFTETEDFDGIVAEIGTIAGAARSAPAADAPASPALPAPPVDRPPADGYNPL